MILHVAVVDRPSSNYYSGRPEGDFAAFISEDKDDVIQRALVARNKWGRDRYRVPYGILDYEVTEPVKYKLVSLESAS